MLAKIIYKRDPKKAYTSQEDKILDEWGKAGHKLDYLQLRYLKKGIRYQGIFDIETSDFIPLGNFIIAFSFIKRDIITGKTRQYTTHITKADIKNAVKHDDFHFDYFLLQRLSKCLFSVDHAVGHFSTKFDTNFFRTRCLLTHQDDLIPEYGILKQGDTWRYMKNTLKAPRNTLRNLALYTGTPDQKTFVSMEHWKRIYFPDNTKWVRSMRYIVTHCRADVKMTFTALKKIEKFNNISTVLN